jgi:hypothetical protein
MPHPPPYGSSIPNVYHAFSNDYDTYITDGNTRKLYRVDPAPLAAFVAAAIGLRDDLIDCMKAIAEDDQDGPIHLIHLLAACQLAAEGVEGSLPSDGSEPEIFKTRGGFIVASVSPVVLPSLVRALRAEGIASATNLARTYSRRERFRALDVLVHYISAPITGLQIGVDDSFFLHRDRMSDAAMERTGSSDHQTPRDGSRRYIRWKVFLRAMSRNRR